MNHHHSSRGRALLRAGGQVGLVLVLAAALMSAGSTLWRCTYDSPEACEGVELTGWLVTPGVSLFTGALSLGLLWASGRDTRMRLAVPLGIALIAAWLILPTGFVLANDMSLAPTVAFMAQYVVFDLGALASTVLLLASYRPTAPLADERVIGLRSRWLWLVLPAVLLAAVLGGRAEAAVGLYQTSLLPVALIAAGAYGVMRRLRPLPDAAPWLLVAALLTALTLPTYAWLALDPSFHFDTEAEEHSAEFAIHIATTATTYTAACGIAATIVAALAALAIWQRRRARPSTYAFTTAP